MQKLQERAAQSETEISKPQKQKWELTEREKIALEFKKWEWN